MKKIYLPLLLLLLITFLKDIIWTIAIPVWHGPDEQAHFVQVQYYVEKKTLDLDHMFNRSEEVTVSEHLLGTFRDGQGNNKFTYHPEFNIPYTKTIENKIKDLQISSRSQMTGQEAPLYPPLYYILAYPVYLLSYFGNLFDRVYAIRLLSILLHVILVYIAFKIGKIVWKNNIASLGLAALISFHPMLTFLSASIHPDNLLNVIYSLAILFTLLILRDGVKIKSLLILTVLFYLGYQTKILMVFLIPVTGAVVLNKLFNWKISLPLSLLVLLSPIIALFIEAPIPLMPHVDKNSPLYHMTVVEYMKFRIPKLMFEVWPWSWGVFKWLGVVLPIQVLRIITRVAAVIGLGIVIELVRNPTRYFIFFIISSVTFLLYLIFWDYRLMQSIGWSQGLQGRYLFTNIIPHMALIIYGAFGLSRLTRLPQKITVGVVVCLMVALNIVAFMTLYNSYYTSLDQVGYYKPAIVSEILTQVQ